MELKLNSGDRVNIPNGCKAVIDGGVITIEKDDILDELKSGDFICYSYREMGSECCLAIFEGIYKFGKTMLCHIVFEHNDYVKVNSSIDGVPKRLRLATEEEKQWMLEKLHAEGKDWDAVNKRIVEYRWQPKYGEDYYVINTLFNVIRLTWSSSGFDFDLLVNRNCFKTEEEAKAKADEIIKIINKQDYESRINSKRRD